MGCPDAAYKELMHDYIQNSFKFNKELLKRYNSNYLYSLSIKELEEIVKRINPETPMYNAMMAGAIYNNWIESACIDQVNASCAIFEDYLGLFNIKMPEKLNFKE